MRFPTTAAEVVIWVLMAALTLCFGGFIFFVRRFIQHNDEHHKKVDDKLGDLEDAVEDNGKMVAAAVQKVNDTGASLERSALVFQKEINKEITAVHKSTTDIAADVQKVQGFVADLQNTVMKHQESLSTGAKAMVKQRDDLLAMRTTVTQISKDVVILGQKMVKKGSGDSTNS